MPTPNPAENKRTTLFGTWYQDDFAVRQGLIEVEHDPAIVTIEDLEAALRAAVDEYLHTDEALDVIRFNCGAFNWGDAHVYMPDEIWCRHGIFRFDMSFEMPATLEHDEHLVPADVEERLYELKGNA